jgi:hypothetical protein
MPPFNSTAFAAAANAAADLVLLSSSEAPPPSSPPPSAPWTVCTVTMLGIPATALEAAMEKARAKASREQPDLGSEYS